MSQQLKPGHIVCPTCRGEGTHLSHQALEKCPRCRGEGQIPAPPEPTVERGEHTGCYTPPPWLDDPKHPECGLIVTKDGTPIARTFDNVDGWDEPCGDETSLANTRLILASPEMARLLRVTWAALNDSTRHFAENSDAITAIPKWVQTSFAVQDEIKALVAKLPEEGK